MIYVCLFIMGTIFASFYTVVGMRLPNGKSIISPRSHCESCNRILKWYELIPIISFFITSGRCRACNAKISLIYPLIELLGGILFVLSYLIFGFTYNTLIMLIISSLLIIIFVSDFKYFVILDSPLLISSILIFIIRYLDLGLKNTLIYVLCGFSMFVTMYLIKLLGDRLFKRESLGGGDIKLSFVMGLVLGFRLGIFSLIIASFLALPYAFYLIYSKKADNEMPFGPFLISALLIVFMFISYFQDFINLFVI